MRIHPIFDKLHFYLSYKCPVAKDEAEGVVTAEGGRKLPSHNIFGDGGSVDDCSFIIHRGVNQLQGISIIIGEAKCVVF